MSNQLPAASFTYFGEVLRCPHKRIVTITKVYIARNNIGPTRGNNKIPYKLATLMTFETLKWKYTFARNVLIVTRDESPLVYRAPESASEHSHFGLLRNVVNSRLSYRDKHDSGLHNCTISSYYVQAVRTESR